MEWHTVDRVWKKFFSPQSIPNLFEDRQEWDKLHKLRGEKNSRETCITRHVANWVMWESLGDTALPHPKEVPLADYLSWYSKLTVTLIQESKPVGDPPIEVADEATVIPSGQFEPHRNLYPLLVSKIQYFLILII